MPLDDFPLFDAECPPPLSTLGHSYNQLRLKADSLHGAALTLAQALRRYVNPMSGKAPGDGDKAFALAALEAFKREVAA